MRRLSGKIALKKKSYIPKIRQESKTPQRTNHKQKTFLVISFTKKNVLSISSNKKVIIPQKNRMQAVKFFFLSYKSDTNLLIPLCSAVFEYYY